MCRLEGGTVLMTGSERQPSGPQVGQRATAGQGICREALSSQSTRQTQQRIPAFTNPPCAVWGVRAGLPTDVPGERGSGTPDPLSSSWTDDEISSSSAFASSKQCKGLLACRGQG